MLRLLYTSGPKNEKKKNKQKKKQNNMPFYILLYKCIYSAVCRTTFTTNTVAHEDLGTPVPNVFNKWQLTRMVELKLRPGRSRKPGIRYKITKEPNQNLCLMKKVYYKDLSGSTMVVEVFEEEN